MLKQIMINITSKLHYKQYDPWSFEVQGVFKACLKKVYIPSFLEDRLLPCPWTPAPSLNVLKRAASGAGPAVLELSIFSISFNIRVPLYSNTHMKKAQVLSSFMTVYVFCA